MVSKCRQKYDELSEAGVNKQVNHKLNASNQYRALAAYFSRDDVALKGFAKMFQKIADEKVGDAEKLMAYQNRRGGRVFQSGLKQVNQQEWASPLSSIEYALKMEKTSNQSLLELHKTASSVNDPHLVDYIEVELLKYQVQLINTLANYHTRLELAGDGLGVCLLDKELQ